MVKACFFGTANNGRNLHSEEHFIGLSTKSIRGPEPSGLDNCAHYFWLSVNKFLSSSIGFCIFYLLQYKMLKQKMMFFSFKLPPNMQILTIIISNKKKWFYHLKSDFTSLFWAFQKCYLEDHRTIFKGIRGKKLF